MQGPRANSQSAGSPGLANQGAPTGPGRRRRSPVWKQLLLGAESGCRRPRRTWVPGWSSRHSGVWQCALGQVPVSLCLGSCGTSPTHWGLMDSGRGHLWGPLDLFNVDQEAIHSSPTSGPPKPAPSCWLPNLSPHTTVSFSPGHDSSGSHVVFIFT